MRIRQILSSFPGFALLAAVGLLCHQSALAADYYVDRRVATSGSGSIAAPFKTIQEALSRVAPGDIVSVRGDAVGVTYTETPSLPVAGSAGQPITVRSYPGEVVILTGSSGSRLSIDHDYWTFDGLIIDQANILADAVKVNAMHVVIQNCEIRNGQREGISIEKAADITITDCSIHDFVWISSGTRMDAHCIMIDTGVSSTINGIYVRRNTIRNCSGDGTQIFGVTGQSIASYAKNVEFIDNDFIDGSSAAGLTENALDFKAADGVVIRGNRMSGYHNNKTIVVQKGCRNIRVENNEISDGLSGMEFREEGGSAFIQENQSVIGNLIHDMSSYALKFDDVRNVMVLNNTFVRIGAEPLRFESTLGSGTPSVDGGVIKNNLVQDAKSAPSGVSLVSGVAIGFNGWFQASAGSLAQTTDTSGSDPGFVGSTTGNYHLAAGSPCIDAGDGVGLPYVGAAPDLGAFEYSPGGDSVSPSAIRDLRSR